jgi:hypothetical protein
MRTEKSHAVAAVVLAGILVVTAATPSFARNGRWAAAGIGFAAGVSGGALLANYYGGYYAPSYYAPPPAYYYRGYYYGPRYGYYRWRW